MIQDGMSLITYLTSPLLSQVEQLGSILSLRNPYLDWKFFILHVAHPYPVPNQKDLLNALQAYTTFDTANIGRITREEFLKVKELI